METEEKKDVVVPAKFKALIEQIETMSVLELHIDSGGPSAQSLYDRHLTILRQRPLLIWGDIPPADLDWLFSKLPPQGLAIITVVKSVEQARELWRKYVERA